MAQPTVGTISRQVGLGCVRKDKSTGSILQYLAVYSHVVLCVLECFPMCTHKGPRRVLGIYLSITLSHPMRQGSLSKLEDTAKLFVSKPPPSLCLTVLELKDRGMFTQLFAGTRTQVLMPAHRVFLPTEPPLQPHRTQGQYSVF